MSFCTTPAASSKSEFVIWPKRFCCDTRFFTISLGNVAGHKMGPNSATGVSVPLGGCQCRSASLTGNQTPPMPCPEASYAPRSSGVGCGTISYSRVGRCVRSRAIHLKSSIAAWTSVDKRMRLSVWWRRASCIRLNNPRLPGNAIYIDRSSKQYR
jgi:hypothetical protein